MTPPDADSHTPTLDAQARASSGIRIDQWNGPAFYRALKRIGADTEATWISPIAPRTDGPPLAWFRAPLADVSLQAWIRCIDTVLTTAPSIGLSAENAALMRCVREANIFDPLTLASRAAPGLEQPVPHERVLLIDERAESALSAPKHERQAQFETMIETALREHPAAEFWLARSAQNASGEWLSRACTRLPENLKILEPGYSICASLPRFAQVYTVSASEGMQSLLLGVPVNVFGETFYAGWGLTRDASPQPRRQARPPLAALFEAVFVRLARYRDPFTHGVGPLDALLGAIEAQRAAALRFADLKHVAGIRFQWWKRPFATPYLTAGGGRLRWVDSPQKIGAGECAAFWGGRPSEGLPPDTPMLRLEDGFLHSTGLGSDHIAPCSQVIDRRGIYFDASKPSDLTHILNHADFADAELARASALRRQITRLGLTKYNLGRRRPAWQAPPGKRVVLVPGQVADDASIRLGTRGITTAEELLRTVRAQRPDAFVVYKPHPDVLSGNRQGLIEAQGLADVVDTHADLISLLECADEVHTLSSLSGFEALLRDKQVYTYGLPFYAGWGLTHDALEQPWRERQLSLDMLVAGALLRYPLYWDWKLGLFTTPEAIAHQLGAPAARPLERIRGNPLRPLRKAWRWSRNGLRHFFEAHG